MRKIFCLFSVALFSCLVFFIVNFPCFANGAISKGVFRSTDSEYKAGDADQSGNVDLTDLLIILKLLSDVSISQTIYLSADVDGDSIIGLEEAIYVLQYLSEIRVVNQDVTQIVLNGNSISVNGTGATADGSNVTITSAGKYEISGSLTDGQIIVNTEDEETVRLILNGINISNSTSAPINVISAEEVVIELKDNTENYVTDADDYVFESGEDEPNAAIFSKDDLSIEGNGSLTVKGNCNDGIASKDKLIITSGNITVNAKDDGIRGKDYLVIKDGNITVNAGGDALKSDNDEDATKGYISIESGTIEITAGEEAIQAATYISIKGGTVNLTAGEDAIQATTSVSIEDGEITITAEGDGIQAETDVIITNGEINLKSGGGSNNNFDETTSTKGIKGVASITIGGGTFVINSADDAIHSNGTIAINGGTFDISSGDDGVHADTSIEINDGTFNITKSYEGIESENITINNGNIHVVSSDDGLNVAGGNDGSGINRPGGFNPPSGNYYLYINGGYIYVDAAGDGLDANGSIEMTAGDVIVNGPTDSANGALDYDGSFKITGGFLLAAGSSGMAQAPSTTSTQYSVLVTFNTSQQAGSLIHIQSSNGNGILTFAPSKRYQAVAFSSSELTKGSTYEVYYGGSSTGTNNDGLYQNGSYSPGTRYTSFTISSTVTNVGGNTRP